MEAVTVFDDLLHGFRVTDVASAVVRQLGSPQESSSEKSKRQASDGELGKW